MIFLICWTWLHSACGTCECTQWISKVNNKIQSKITDVIINYINMDGIWLNNRFYMHDNLNELKSHKTIWRLELLNVVHQKIIDLRFYLYNCLAVVISMTSIQLLVHIIIQKIWPIWIQLMSQCFTLWLC